MGTCGGVELDDLVLDGPHLQLRPWRADDADAVAAVMQDRSMHDYLALPDPYTARDAHEFVTGPGVAARRDGVAVMCAVVERASGALVGAADLRLGPHPDIGYWVARAARGRGHAAEATRLLADAGFARLGLRRIALGCDVTNLASVRTALAAGFTFEGVGRRGAPTTDAAGEWGDLAHFARLAVDDGRPVRAAFPELPAGGLGDPVVTLRVTEPGDARALHESDIDPVSMQWGFTATPTPFQTRFARCRRAGLDRLVGQALMLSILDATTGEVAGELVLRRPGPPQVGAFGYTVHPRFRGRGMTARALRLVSAWAFEAAGFVRLELGAKAGNLASQRAAERAGFTRTATQATMLRNPDGTFSDEVQYALLAPSRA